MTQPLVVSGLTSLYPNGRGITDVSFLADEGEVLGISGANGSGKTTLFRVLSTLSRPQKGTVTIQGWDSVAEKQEARRHFFPVFDGSAHLGHATGMENLRLFLDLYGSKHLDRAGSLARHFHLDLDSPAGEYSLGMRRKLVLMQALLSGKGLLLFDEPTLGLDSSGRSAFLGFVHTLAAEGTTIVIGTNRNEEVSRVARVLFLSEGSLSDTDPGRDPAGMIELRVIREDDEQTEYVLTPEEIPEVIARLLPLGIPREIRIRSREEKDLVWSHAALEKAGRAPPFVRGMVVGIVERYAREQGYRHITPDIVDAARRKVEPR